MVSSPKERCWPKTSTAHQRHEGKATAAAGRWALSFGLRFCGESLFSLWRWPIAAPQTCFAGSTPATTPLSRRRATAATAGGMAAIQIAPVAERAGVAAGTVYRYFPGKIELVGALVESVAEREIEAVRRAADAAPGPLSALAAARRHLRRARVAQPQARLGGDRRAGRHRHRCGAAAVSPRACRPRSRRASARRSTAAICRTRTRALPRSALVGALLEGLIGPLAPDDMRRPGARARSGADADAVRAARAWRGRCPRPRPRGADRPAGRNRVITAASSPRASR